MQNNENNYEGAESKEAKKRNRIHLWRPQKLQKV